VLDAVSAGAGAIDPADRVTLDDEVRGALNLVLDRLTPAERVVFVLHDVFATPFDSIAETVGRPAATCRQLARRARLKIHAGDRAEAPTTDLASRRAIADAFIQACSAGDTTSLIALLDPDVWGAADLGPDDPRSGVVNHGYATVSRNLLRWFTPQITIVFDPLGEECELLAFLDGEPYAQVTLDLAGGLVRSVHVHVEPDQVAWVPPRP
jgi:RNA polymerase sigma-70 factor (ECF subfamily)